MLLSKNLKNKIYRIIIFNTVLYMCETWSIILREECWLRVPEMRLVRRIFGPRGTRLQWDGENYIM